MQELEADMRHARARVVDFIHLFRPTGKQADTGNIVGNAFLIIKRYNSQPADANTSDESHIALFS